MEEIWKDISEYEGYYQVSNLGNIRSLIGWDGHKYINRIKNIKWCKGTTPYPYVLLHKNKITKRFDIHRLVAQTFLPNPLNLPVVMHIDDNPMNNNVSNLKWGTQKENVNTKHHKKALSEAMSGRFGELNNFYGHKHTEETKRHLSEIRKAKHGKI